MKEKLHLKHLNIEKQEQSENTVEKVISMEPGELVGFLMSLEKENKLEEFLETNMENDAFSSHLSYWEKWLEKDQRKLVDKIIEKKKEIYDSKEINSSESLPLYMEKKFTEEEIKLIFSNIKSIQLTFGCSKGCPFCGFDALPGVREHIPYSKLANLFKKYGKEIGASKPMLYWASEPSDYKYEEQTSEWTYKDAHQLATQYAKYKPHITTSKINDKNWIDFIDAESSKPRISVPFKKEDDTKKLLEKEKKNIKVTDDAYFEAFGPSVFKNKEFQDLLERNEGKGAMGIGCMDGVLLTPRGLYNIVLLEYNSNKYPQAQIITPIEKISDEKITTGDHIEQHLRCSVVQGKNLTASEAFFDFKSKFREVVLLKNKNQYKIWIDNEGIIQKIENLS